MGILDRFSYFFGAKKQYQAAPEVLAGALNLMSQKHLAMLLKLFNENHIVITEEQGDKISIELFCFYYSLFSLILDRTLASETDMHLYGSLLLNEWRKLLGESHLSDSMNRFVRDKDTFLSEFDTRFRYYYHGTVSPEERKALDTVTRFCQADQSNQILYLAAKLQLHISSIVRQTSSEPLFIPLWIRQSTMVIGFAKTVTNIRPTLRERSVN